MIDLTVSPMAGCSLSSSFTPASMLFPTDWWPKRTRFRERPSHAERGVSFMDFRTVCGPAMVSPLQEMIRNAMSMTHETVFMIPRVSGNLCDLTNSDIIFS